MRSSSYSSRRTRLPGPLPVEGGRCATTRFDRKSGNARTLAANVALVQAAAAAPATPAAAPAAAPAPGAAGSAAGQTPIQVEAAAAKGTLKNPYSDDNTAITEEGHQLFMNYSCSGCHGGTGGGGMCPPLINDVWVYNGDDDTLFRLVTLGSVALQAKGYARRGRENVVAPMLPVRWSGSPRPMSSGRSWPGSVPRTRAEPNYKYGSPPPPAPATGRLSSSCLH